MSDNGASRVPPVDETPAAESAEPITAVSLAWLPAGDYERALDLWPDFAGSDLVTGPDGPVAHPLYCRRMQQKLVEFAEAGFPGLAVAAIRVAPFAAWCAEQGQEPDSPEARAEYAAYLTAHGDHDVMAWPPGRNQQCWCGSGPQVQKVLCRSVVHRHGTRTVKTARLQVTLRCAVDLINSSSDQCFARIEHVASDQADPRPGVWHSSGMNRIRLSTTVDAALLTSARDMRAGITDAALIDEALAALLARHRSAEVDASYAAYDKHPVDEPDEWGDLASWRRAAGDS